MYTTLYEQQIFLVTGDSMIYFDNAATSFKKPLGVKIAILKAINHCTANPGRSGHRASLKAGLEITKARLKIKNFFNCESENNVIFTQNCTDALNLAILGSLKDGGHVVVSCFEHNSVLRPLKHLEDSGKITLSIVYPKGHNYITLQDILPYIKSNTYMVCLSHISNVTGNINDIVSIGKYCKDNNITFLVDAAQSCGHVDIDMQRDNIDLLAFAGHKGLFAPLSIGGLCINNDNKLNNIRFGGTGTNSIELSQPKFAPEKYESGTLSTPLIMGLSAGVSYVAKHFERNIQKIKYLTKYLISRLSSMPNITLYTNHESIYGVVCFNIKDYDSVEISSYLDEKYNIAVRGGLHCAPLSHKHLGTTKTGAIRISLNHYNTKRQIDKLIKVLSNIQQ